MTVCVRVCPTGLKGLWGKSTVFHYVQKKEQAAVYSAGSCEKKEPLTLYEDYQKALFLFFFSQASLCAIYYSTHLSQIKETHLNGCVFCARKKGGVLLLQHL